MNHVFLDLGTHFGQGLREFIDNFRMNDSWIIHTFEANPITHKKFIDEHLKRTPWVISHNEAISDHNGELEFNIETPPGEESTGMGSSAIGLDKWNPWKDEEKTKEAFVKTAVVPCIDLSEFVMNNFQPEDRIVVKMDIEGSEYDTLERMIETGVIKYIDEIFVEWHSHMFKNSDEIKQREDKIISYLNENNIKLESWR
jgi:FkbM family methyltransferase